MIVLDMEQGTPEWFHARLGVLTASELHKVFTAVKGEYSKQAEKYMIKLMAEKLTGERDETYSNDAMERGKVMEAEARSWYEITTGNKVEEVGFIFKDERRRVGCSPDGLVESRNEQDKGLEIKCVIGSTMVTYMMKGDDYTYKEYKQQVQGSMFAAGVDEWDLLIYHPKLEPILINVKRDPDYQRIIEMHTARFISEMDVLVEKFENRGKK